MTGSDARHATWLAAYDALRGERETPSAIAVEQVGPVRLVRFAGGRGFVTYRDLGGLDAAGVTRLVAEIAELLAADPTIDRAEWKTRGHDVAPGLHDALVAHGFAPDEPESIMIGELSGLVRAPVPDGVTVRQVVEQDDVRAWRPRRTGRSATSRRPSRPMRCCVAGRSIPTSSCGWPRSTA